jgi:hypothetical protein
MLTRLRNNKTLQMLLAALLGTCFGFLLNRGGVTDFDVLVGQLLLTDWTVAKVLLSAVVTGMVGLYALRRGGWAGLHRTGGSLGATVVGGLIFGAGFALLGYCPGTMAGAVGHGAMDALLGGVPGMLLGTWAYSLVYTRVRGIREVGEFGQATLDEALGWSRGATVLLAAACIVLFFLILEGLGL